MCSRAVPFAPQNHLWPQKKTRDAAATFSAKIQLPKHPGEKLTEQIPTHTVEHTFATTNTNTFV